MLLLIPAMTVNFAISWSSIRQIYKGRRSIPKKVGEAATFGSSAIRYTECKHYLHAWSATGVKWQILEEKRSILRNKKKRNYFIIVTSYDKVLKNFNVCKLIFFFSCSALAPWCKLTTVMPLVHVLRCSIVMAKVSNASKVRSQDLVSLWPILPTEDQETVCDWVLHFVETDF